MSESPANTSEHRSTSLRVSVFGIAFLVGFIGALLLPVNPWGINVLLFIVILLAASIFLIRRNHLTVSGGGRWLVIPILLFAALYAFRASSTLIAANLLALLMLLGLAALRTQQHRLRVAGVLDYAFDWVQSAILAPLGIMPLVAGTSWSQVSFGRRPSATGAVVRGLFIAVPLLLVFGGLFTAADAVFQGFVSQLFNFDARTIFTTVWWTLFWGWLVAGFLYALLIYRPPQLPQNLRPNWLALGPIEITIILGLLNALFIAFVIVQLRYFFGGADLVQGSTGLSYAEYARRGFFELVTVAALVLPVLLGTHWLYKPNSPRGKMLFNLLAFVLIAMLFVIMASAVQRMRLYIDVFGLTELRLYTTAFMAWLALMFLWFIVTVLRDARNRFAFGALMLGLGVLVFLNAMNPDDWIVSVNLSRPEAAEPLDSAYIASLSEDAFPALVRALPALPPKARCEIADEIIQYHKPPREFGEFEYPQVYHNVVETTFDWRTLNYGRYVAWQTTAANWQVITEACPKS